MTDYITAVSHNNVFIPAYSIDIEVEAREILTLSIREYEPPRSYRDTTDDMRAKPALSGSYRLLIGDNRVVQSGGDFSMIRFICAETATLTLNIMVDTHDNMVYFKPFIDVYNPSQDTIREIAALG